MSFFDELFGKKKPESSESHPVRPHTPAVLPPVKAQPAQSPAAPPVVDPARDKNMIQVFDAYGREMHITKDVWRKNVLPGTLKSNWDKPDQLAGIIIGALSDGFRSDVIAAAEHLYQIDPQPERGTCVWAVVLNEEGNHIEAEKVLRGYIAKHGENGSVLTNLAKVYAKRSHHREAEEILWHALKIDPNQDNGLGWYTAIHKDRGGEVAWLKALHRIAALPGSWRAQLWLARSALQSKDLESALAYYHQALSHVKPPVPTDLLGQMSGDLGNAAHLPELLQLTEPYFVP